MSLPDLTNKASQCSLKWYRKNRARCLRQKKKYRREHVEKIRKYVKKYYRAHREELLRAWRERYPRGTGIRKAYRHKYNKAHKRENAAEERRYRRKFPERSSARWAVYRAVRTGMLTRPRHCSKCGRECKPNGHHHRGYAKEFWLDVIWLCMECHVAEHCPSIS